MMIVWRYVLWMLPGFALQLAVPVLLLAAAGRLAAQGWYPAAGWARRGALLLLVAASGAVLNLPLSLLLLQFSQTHAAPGYSAFWTGFRALLTGVGMLYLLGAFAMGASPGGGQEMDSPGEGEGARDGAAAGLVHCGVLLPLLGPLIALVVAAMNRHKDPFLARHARQAFGFQTAVSLIWAAVLFALALLAVWRARLLVGPGSVSAVLLGGGLGLFYLSTLIFAIYAAVQGWSGRPYTYPFGTEALEEWENRAQHR